MFYNNRLWQYFVVIFILLNFFILLSKSVLAQTVNTPDYDSIGLASVVLNAQTGKLISGQNYNTTLPLASLTKLMTAVILAKQNLNFNKKVIITKEEISYVNPYIEAGDVTSQINLKAGDKVAINDLWNAMLIASSNEAAIALVDNSGLSRKEFVAAMNRQAKSWGLKSTYFTEVSGIDPKNIGTALEMAIIAQKAYAYPSIRLASAKASYKFRDLISGRRISVISRNSSLLAMKPLGMKVGYLVEAKINVALRLKKGLKDRVIVVLHAVNNALRNREINRLALK